MTNQAALRQLDAQLAKKVMGWFYRVDYTDDLPAYYENVNGLVTPMKAVGTWNPTTDWRAAGELMDSIGWPLMIEKATHYKVTIGYKGENYSAGVDTGPLAISLAVAKAYGIEIPEELA